MTESLRRSLAAALLLVAGAALAGEPDMEGCKDPPLISRFPGYRIQLCEASDFDAKAFRDPRGREVTVEGRYGMVQYTHEEGTTQPSRLQVHRNYENALKKLGPVASFNDGEGTLSLMLKRDAKEIWVKVEAGLTFQYNVTVVEKAGMAQELTASADALATGLKATGHVAIYGVFFDTGLAVVKPESAAALAEIAKLLKAEPDLRLYVVGHTDSVGSLESNLRLSLLRSDAVIRALTERHGVAPARLRGAGLGPYAPVASNDAEEGRARNRRVELVKQ